MKKMHYNFSRTLSATLLLIAMTMFCLQAKADDLTFTQATNISPTTTIKSTAVYENSSINILKFRK